MFVDRFMSTAMHYPCNYGYIPHTLSDDGDPCDVLVLSPVPLITGVVVRCRPIGMLKMDDEAGGDAKILAVPVDKLSGLYRAIQSPRDLPEITTQQIAHFFEHYKDLEPGKWVRDLDLGRRRGGEAGDPRRHRPLRARESRQPRPPDDRAVTDRAHARRQLAFPVAVRAAVEHGLHRRQVRAAVRAAAHLPALPLRARRRADGAWSRWRRGASWPQHADRGRARRGVGVARARHLPRRRASSRSPAACRPAPARCWSGCSRSSRC